MNKNHFIILLLFGYLSILSACQSGKVLTENKNSSDSVQLRQFSGGSSGMEQFGDNSYIVVYDLKNFRKGERLAMILLTDSTFNIHPIKVDFWDAEGVANDLESISAIPGKDDEFLVAESGNWQGKFGRIFHIKVDFISREANILGSTKLPFQHRNDFGLTGDQCEAILCLPYKSNEIILLFSERGGSESFPNGIVYWGKYNLENKTLIMDENGRKGKIINVPGNWNNANTKRDITDFHIDKSGNIWAVASEDQGDFGPFYSVIYQLGKVDKNNSESPIEFVENIQIAKEIYGFKIEALSGPSKKINSDLSFGSEDEIYGGVWRPVLLNK